MSNTQYGNYDLQHAAHSCFLHLSSKEVYLKAPAQTASSPLRFLLRAVKADPHVLAGDHFVQKEAALHSLPYPVHLGPSPSISSTILSETSTRDSAE